MHGTTANGNTDGPASASAALQLTVRKRLSAKQVRKSIESTVDLHSSIHTSNRERSGLDLVSMRPTQTRAALAARAAESVVAAGALARLVSKNASSPTLQATIATFVEYEHTLEFTNEMLHRVNEGVLALDEAVEEISAALSDPLPVET